MSNHPEHKVSTCKCSGSSSGIIDAYVYGTGSPSGIIAPYVYSTVCISYSFYGNLLANEN